MPRRSALSPLRVHLFGRCHIEAESGPIRLPPHKIQALLAYLILHPTPQSREKLAALLWGDVTDGQARHSLRSALLTLRKALGDEIILADDESVQLNPQYPIWVDVYEFQHGISTSPESTVELYQGDLLSDFYEDWVLSWREPLRELYLEALLQLAQQARAQSQYAHAIGFAQKVLASDPANEKAYQQSVFCYAAMGNRTAALHQYEQCKVRLHEELGVEPSRETQALYHWLVQAPIASREAQITNLPIPLTSFIGREREMTHVRQLLARTRLMTLIGAGGSGKTRLAIQVATDLVSTFEQGVWWIDFAPLTDETLVPHSVAKALGVRESPSEPLGETICNTLRSRELLLVLDNCEHLVNACAQLALTLLSAAPRVKILATSRVAFHVSGETVWHVPTLSVPDVQHPLSVADLEQYEAVRLFAERAGAVKSDFALTPQNAHAVAQICRRLDGIPLAIELAAARMQVLLVEQIAAHLDDRFHLLTEGSRAALPRHRTLRALMDWSYDLLLEKERTLLRRLSVFAGDWGLEAAESVASDEGGTLARSEILDLLSRLVDNSLVVAEERAGQARYRMLETLLQYGVERLAEAGEVETFRRRHTLYFAGLAEKAEQDLRGPEFRGWIERLEMEHDNLRAALEWSIARESPETSLRFAGAMGIFWSKRGYLREGQTWLERLLSRAVDAPPQLRAKAMAPAGWFARVLGDYDRAIALNEASLAILREAGDQLGMVDVLNQRGMVAMYQGDFKRAFACFDESLALCEELGYRWGRALPLVYLAQTRLFNLQWNEQAKSQCQESLELFKELDDRSEQAHAHIILGLGAHFEGDDRRARSHLEQAVMLCRESGDRRQLAWSTAVLGLTVRWQGKLSEALLLVNEGLRLALELGDKTAAANALQFLALLAKDFGQMERSSRLWGFTIAWGESFGFRLAPMMWAIHKPEFSAVRAALGEPLFAKAWAEGQAMTPEEGIEYALAVEKPREDLTHN